MKDKMRRIIELVRRTGDTVVVTDPEGDDIFVVMGLDRYESLFNGASQEIVAEKLTDQITQKSTESEPEIWDTMQLAGQEGETWDLSTMKEDELAELEDQYRQFAQKNISEAIKETQKVEEKHQEKPEETDAFGEEQFYLEPIE